MSKPTSLDDSLLIPLSDGVTMEFRPIVAADETASFMMGSNYARLTPNLCDSWDLNAEPRHHVRLSQFYLGRFAVTQREFHVWTASTNYEHENHFKRSGYDHHPAENMDWEEAMAFCAWLNGLDALKTQGLVATLPSEAQWQYACRADTDTEFYNGDGEAALQAVAWYREEYEEGSTHEVGQLPPNEFNLHDMHGNVDEWCRDAWDEHAYRKRVSGVLNPQVFNEDDELFPRTWESTPSGQNMANNKAAVSVQLSGSESSSFRVVCGGSWDFGAGWCRSARRDRGIPYYRDPGRGFRVCLVPACV